MKISHKSGCQERTDTTLRALLRSARLAMVALAIFAAAPASVSAEPVSPSIATPQADKTVLLSTKTLATSSSAPAQSLVPVDKDAAAFLAQKHMLPINSGLAIAEVNIPTRALPKILPLSQPLLLMTSSLPPSANSLVPLPKP